MPQVWNDFMEIWEDSERKGGSMSKPAAWEHFEGFLNQEEANKLYASIVNSQGWVSHKDDKGDAYAMYFGRSYQGGKGGAREGERPISDGWQRLADRVADKVKCPVNYIQCHKYGPSVPVLPHRDPAGMTVPMLTIGQERTFRVGGSISNERGTPQKNRELSWHVPEDEYLMRHGDLLVFNGGRTAHSMFSSDKDDQFNPNGCTYRISLIFRWTTDAMRKYGPGKKANTAGAKEQYATAINDYRRKSEQPES